MQIDYIKTLYHNQDIVNDLTTELLYQRNLKEFMDAQLINVPSHVFQKYLELYLKPQHTKQLIRRKYQGLNEKKDNLKQMLQADIDEIDSQIFD